MSSQVGIAVGLFVGLLYQLGTLRVIVERRGGTSRLGVSLETHVKIWYQKLKLKLSYE